MFIHVEEINSFVKKKNENYVTFPCLDVRLKIPWITMECDRGGIVCIFLKVTR